METHDELKAILDTYEQVLSVIDINVELSFDSVVDQYACLYADLVVLGVPVGLVGHGDTLPSVWIHLSESLSDTFDDTFGKDVWLLV